MDHSSSDAERMLSSRRRALGGQPAGALDAEMVEIDAALARIADGTYGQCEVCGGAIGRDRLRALPVVRRCVTCSG
jgi:RNA polymerase-binding transcription factor DksA